MQNEEDILKRKIKIITVKLPEPGKLGSLVLPGSWQCTIAEASAHRLKPHEGDELEIGEISRLLGDSA